MDTAFLSLMERCVSSFSLLSTSYDMSSSSPLAIAHATHTSTPYHQSHASFAYPFFRSTTYSDPTEELLMIIGIFSHFFALETTLAERQFFRALAKLIGRRAARMSACGIAAIVSKMGYLEEGCSVGADGSLYNVRFPQCLLAVDGMLMG